MVRPPRQPSYMRITLQQSRGNGLKSGTLWLRVACRYPPLEHLLRQAVTFRTVNFLTRRPTRSFPSTKVKKSSNKTRRHVTVRALSHSNKRQPQLKHPSLTTSRWPLLIRSKLLPVRNLTLRRRLITNKGRKISLSKSIRRQESIWWRRKASCMSIGLRLVCWRRSWWWLRNELSRPSRD
jgi:hypothetical protein